MKYLMIFLIGALAYAMNATAAPEVKTDAAIVDLHIAEQMNLDVVYAHDEHQLAVANLTEADKARLSDHMHDKGRCGGYELVDIELKSEFGPFTMTEQDSLDSLFEHMPSAKKRFQPQTIFRQPRFSRLIADKVRQVSEDNLRKSVQWISAYKTRHHASKNKNAHVAELARRLQAMASRSNLPIQIKAIDHKRTGQKSLRARIAGTTRANEIVVLGGHFDSINQSFFNKHAPGADDNASGSANLIEIFRLMLDGPRPKRTVEFMWYAAEEVGLVGSAEIAKAYRGANAKVVGVMQLDMTLHPGAGEGTIVFMTDFTSPELTRYVAELNAQYVKAKAIFDKCGYGCSDHASWHRQGYAAVMPFEATMRSMNRLIHTDRDVINSKSSFKHSANFARLGLAFAMNLSGATGN